MRQPDTYSDGRRTGKLEHHSARGKLPRNSGNYTRGSQLIVHEFMMWWGSSKIRILIVLGIFAILYCASLAIAMREHEVQMILMRSHAWMWELMKLNPDKVTNLTLRDGSVVTAHLRCRLLDNPQRRCLPGSKSPESQRQPLQHQHLGRVKHSYHHQHRPVTARSPKSKCSTTRRVCT